MAKAPNESHNQPPGWRNYPITTALAPVAQYRADIQLLRGLKIKVWSLVRCKWIGAYLKLDLIKFKLERWVLCVVDYVLHLVLDPMPAVGPPELSAPKGTPGEYYSKEEMAVRGRASKRNWIFRTKKIIAPSSYFSYQQLDFHRRIHWFDQRALVISQTAICIALMYQLTHAIRCFVLQSLCVLIAFYRAYQ